MDTGGDRNDAVLADFVDSFLDDREKGALPPLSYYLKKFRGRDSSIAHLYARLQQSEASALVRTHHLDGAPTIDVLPPSVGRYLIHEELGRGGFGVVCRGEDPSLRRVVALKLLHRRGLEDPDVRARFRREAEVASRLNHPGICRVYEADLEAAIPYIAMEFVPGEPLSVRIAREMRPASKSKPAPEIARRLALVEQLARAVHAANDVGVIHRDIKPHNIMVAGDGHPVLLDFGLARDESGSDLTLTMSGDVLGTPYYMSPEQLDGKRATRQVDVWALGVVLYEYLTLRRPFEGPTREILSAAIREKDPADPRGLNRAVSKDLRVVIETALEKDPSRRYRTAEELADELRRVRTYEPIHARSAGPALRVKRWAQRRPGVVGSLVLATLCLLGGVIVSTHQALRAHEKADEAEANLLSWRRMSDVRLLQDLEEEAESELWPAWPAKIDAMVAWIMRAEELRSRRTTHERTLRELSGDALPYTDAERAKDRETHPKFQELVEIREKQERRPSELAELALWMAGSRSRRDRLATLEKEVAIRRTWRFANQEQQYRHEVLLVLVERLEHLLVDGGLLTRVRRRLEFARAIDQRSIGAHRAAWDAAIGRVGHDPRFAGFRLHAQVGLVPLGPDPDSTLEEFGVLETTGPLPSRDGESKRLKLSETSGVVLVLIPGGTFIRGSQRTDADQPNYDPWSESLEKPPHEVSLIPFFLSKFEMTQAQWERLAGSNPAHWSYPKANGFRVTPQHPVEFVSWTDCETVLARTGLELPTESQWEFACRAGQATPWWCGADIASIQVAKAGNIADQSARLAGAEGWVFTMEVTDGHAIHAPVGSFAANGFGLHDVLGNVDEWCRDGFAAYDPSRMTKDGFRRPEGDGVRVVRGGDFKYNAETVRSAARYAVSPVTRSDAVGCRPSRRHRP